MSPFRILIAGASPDIQVVDAQTGADVLPALRLGAASTLTANWSLDDRLIVARNDDNLVRVWDAETGEPVTPLLRHGSYVIVANLIANNRLVTLSRPNLLRAWDLTETPLAPDVLADYARLISGRRLSSSGVMVTYQDLPKRLSRALHERQRTKRSLVETPERRAQAYLIVTWFLHHGTGDEPSARS